MKIGLGTVQFGMDYGVSNQSGKTDQLEVGKILSKAIQLGIRKLDTAYLYGDSESALGRNLQEVRHFEVITKTQKFTKHSIRKEDGIVLRECFAESLSRMNLEKVYGLMVHDSQDMLCENSNYLWEEMGQLKSDGKVQKIGVSVYSPSQAFAILEKFKIDIIQFPLSVYDQSFLRSGLLSKLKNLGIEVHVRSVFLQGLALMPLKEIPKYFEPVKLHIQKCQEILSNSGITLLEASLNFIKSIKEVDYAILGINNTNQLEEIVEAYHSEKNFNSIDFTTFAISDENIINPSKWKLN